MGRITKKKEKEIQEYANNRFKSLSLKQQIEINPNQTKAIIVKDLCKNKFGKGLFKNLSPSESNACNEGINLAIEQKKQKKK